jgi:hypothetical protein
MLKNKDLQVHFLIRPYLRVAAGRYAQVEKNAYR